MNFQGKKIALVGFGEEGRANLRYVASLAPATIAVADSKSSTSLSEDEMSLVTQLHLGPSWLEALTDYDIIIRSPGVPLRLLSALASENPNLIITSGTEIFLSRHAPRTIGVTATKGKSTTSSLIYRILSDAGLNVRFGGNIGIPALSLINEQADIFVLELSSYQLEGCSCSPRTALFLNLYPEHLDHHGDFERYGSAKGNIARFQRSDDLLVLPANERLPAEITDSSPAQRLLFGSPSSNAWIEDRHFYMRTLKGEVRRLCSVESILLRGPGNQRNVMAALCAVQRYDIPTERLNTSIMGFKPLPHRLEQVGVVDGVTYINDSISTVPEAAINALETFGSQVKTVILGGYDRGVPFEKLAQYLLTTAVETVILFPPSGTRIEEAVNLAQKGTESQLRIWHAENMHEAIELCKRYSPPGSVCLLSPASPSFPIFTNFEERGEIFRRCVMGENAGAQQQ